ncbi:MAG: GatB/YqeY domain-containing protein [Chitinophagales bacterium]|nr:GatB/YqeY domain-containing protein [Chitinophagales bacterium]
MELEKKVMDMLKEAMKAKDEASLRTLRAIKGAILLAKTEKNAGEMTPEREMQLIQKLAKQRKESIEIYSGQGMTELATKEREELEVLEKFLPKQLSEEEIKPIVQDLISELCVSDIKEMGKVIGAANKKLAGQAEGAIISKIVKEILSRA